MPRPNPPYPLAFRAQMAALVRAGRSPEKLAEEFEPSSMTIRNWVKQANRDEGRREDGLTTDERKELTRLRRENRQLQVERDIPAKAAAWFARETDAIPPLLRVRRGESGPMASENDVPRIGGLHQRILRVAHEDPVEARGPGHRSYGARPGHSHPFSRHVRRP